jgi:hypothetical protein
MQVGLRRRLVFLVGPRMTICSAWLGSGRCGTFAAAHGARIKQPGCDRPCHRPERNGVLYGFVESPNGTKTMFLPNGNRREGFALNRVLIPAASDAESKGPRFLRPLPGKFERNEIPPPARVD